MKMEPTELEGVFERRIVLSGTRSEREVPVLVMADNTGSERVVRVHVIGDESYTEEALAPLVSKLVKVGPGNWRNGVLRVTADCVSIIGAEVDGAAIDIDPPHEGAVSDPAVESGQVPASDPENEPEASA